MDDIVNKSRKREVVNARKDIALQLWKRGYYQDEIAQKLYVSQSAVSYFITNSN